MGGSWIYGKTALGTTVTAIGSPFGGLFVRLIWDDPETQKSTFCQRFNTVSSQKVCIRHCVVFGTAWNESFGQFLGCPKALPWDGPKIQPILFGRVKRFSQCLWESPKMLESTSIPIIVRGSPKTQLTLSWNRHWTWMILRLSKDYSCHSPRMQNGAKCRRQTPN